MEIRTLKYFLALAREGSISGAAQSLHITQPTLSRQLKELEYELNTTLFIRGNRNISLTADGLLLKKRAQEITMLVDKTENDFLHNDKIINGDLYIGCGESDAMRTIASVIKEMQSEYPHVKVHLFSGNADDLTEKLDKGLLDFCIVIEPADIKKYDFLKLPGKDKWGLLMPNNSPLCSNKTIKPDDLWNIPILASRQTMVSNEFSGWLGADFSSLNIVGTYNLIYNASLMVQEGVGYALCLDKLINTSNDSKLCFRPLFPKLECQLDIIWKKNSVLSSVSLNFLKRLQKRMIE
ncbi:MAG: LysR family transcriptional regulator [Clostridium butyricum]|nr:LysR family transcriptional regulator [Clostridium butyricum]